MLLEGWFLFISVTLPTKYHQPLCFDPQQFWQKDVVELLLGISENFTHLSSHLLLVEFMEMWFHFGISKGVELKHKRDETRTFRLLSNMIWVTPSVFQQDSVPLIASDQGHQQAGSLLRLLWPTTPVHPAQMLLAMSSFGPLNSHSFPSILWYSPTPSWSWPWLTGADSTEKSRPSGSWMVDLGLSLQEWTRGQVKAGTHQSACHQVFAELPEDLVPCWPTW